MTNISAEGRKVAGRGWNDRPSRHEKEARREQHIARDSYERGVRDGYQAARPAYPYQQPAYCPQPVYQPVYQQPVYQPVYQQPAYYYQQPCYDPQPMTKGEKIATGVAIGALIGLGIAAASK